MKKVSAAARKQGRNISRQTLTIGLDLGDRNSCYCVVDEARQIQREQRVRTEKSTNHCTTAAERQWRQLHKTKGQNKVKTVPGREKTRA